MQYLIAFIAVSWNLLLVVWFLFQNVNKVNTKATLRCPANASWIPCWALSDVVKNPHYVASTHSILITSTVHRCQSQNIDECLQKLHSLILTAASKYIKSAPSDSQKKKVEGFVKAEKTRRKMEKIRRSNIKQTRSGKGGGFDFQLEMVSICRLVHILVNYYLPKASHWQRIRLVVSFVTIGGSLTLAKC